MTIAMTIHDNWGEFTYLNAIYDLHPTLMIKIKRKRNLIV